MQDLQKEFREYWNAVDKRRKAAKIDVLTGQINTLSDYDFSALYEAYIHNTQEDELADIIITCATWYRAAELAEEGRKLQRAAQLRYAACIRRYQFRAAPDDTGKQPCSLSEGAEP